MNIVVHWVLEPRLEGKGHGVPLFYMLDMLRISAKVKHGDCDFWFLTDMDTPAPFNWQTFRVARDGENVMGHIMECRAAICDDLEGNTLFCDADSLVCRNLDGAFQGDWALKVAWHPRYLASSVLCKDHGFARGFFLKAAEGIRKTEPHERLFGADQTVVKEMIEEDGTGIEKAQQSEISLPAPDTRAALDFWSPRDAYVVSFKGTRKRWMGEVFKQLCSH